MKFAYGRDNNRVFEVNPRTDYVVHNGTYAFLYYRNCIEKEWKPDAIGNSAKYRDLSLPLFDKILKDGLIEFVQESKYGSFVKYYRFTPKTHFTIELYK